MSEGVNEWIFSPPAQYKQTKNFRFLACLGKLLKSDINDCNLFNGLNHIGYALLKHSTIQNSLIRSLVKTAKLLKKYSK
ncbi:hypothetical protein C8P68_10111 [Mucilaginibacter yixingensis]|uniref:Uncharacterized protein n=1 Tax=Mucilaginibacter yixingensis TaxID=1295612 RepID=A0A2T5JEG7_9SPHI|nr:hypothetical protein C8P68_10111 [Mucilaginibacter yixingensis]